MSRRRALAVGLVSALILSVGLSAQTDKKTEEALAKDGQAFSKLADAALLARGGPNDFNIAWVNQDFLKGPDGKEYVPFSITLDPTKVPSPSFVVDLACLQYNLEVLREIQQLLPTAPGRVDRTCGGRGRAVDARHGRLRHGRRRDSCDDRRR